MFDMAINDFDVQKTGATFVTVQKMAPIVKNCSGKFSSTMKAEGLFDQHMSPVMESLNGYGNLKTSTLTVQNFPPLVKVADALKMEKLKKMRSEEHTSELQSLTNLVCRLLLEKKTKTHTPECIV